MYFDAALVFVTKSSLLLRLAVAILCTEMGVAHVHCTYHAALSFAIGSISKVSRKPSNFVLFTVIRCGYPGHLLNGHVIGRSYLFGDVIHYSCHEGYKLQGSKSRQCNEHGFWTGVRPACKGKRQLCMCQFNFKIH